MYVRVCRLPHTHKHTSHSFTLCCSGEFDCGFIVPLKEKLGTPAQTCRKLFHAIHALHRAHPHSHFVCLFSKYKSCFCFSFHFRRSPWLKSNWLHFWSFDDSPAVDFLPHYPLLVSIFFRLQASPYGQSEQVKRINQPPTHTHTSIEFSAFKCETMLFLIYKLISVSWHWEVCLDHFRIHLQKISWEKLLRTSLFLINPSSSSPLSIHFNLATCWIL